MTTTNMKDYSIALTEFVDICNTGVSDYQNVWQSNSIRALVRKCTGLLTRLSINGNEFDTLKSIARSDLLGLSESIQAQGNVYDEFIREAERCGKRNPLPNVEEFTFLVERIRVKQASTMSQLDSVRALVELSSYDSGDDNELKQAINELCDMFFLQSGSENYDPTVLENLVKFKNNWFPTNTQQDFIV
jgi:hypothetical protein